MARWYMIAGIRLHRRSVIKLSADERAALAATGRAAVRRPVEWPLPDHTPDFARAYADPGGTDIWGPGPYLKVPSRIAGDDTSEPVNRVFCPWGYPPDRVRVTRSSVYLQLAAVAVARVGPAAWEWVLSVVPWVPAADNPGPAEPTAAADGGGG